jgi:hypothetical protein
MRKLKPAATNQIAAVLGVQYATISLRIQKAAGNV